MEVKDGIVFDSGHIEEKEKKCPNCGSEYVYTLVLQRECKKHFKADTTDPEKLESKLLKETVRCVGIEDVVEFPIKKGIRLINNIGVS